MFHFIVFKVAMRTQVKLIRQLLTDSHIPASSLSSVFHYLPHHHLVHRHSLLRFQLHCIDAGFEMGDVDFEFIF